MYNNCCRPRYICAVLLAASVVYGQTPSVSRSTTTPKQAFGFDIGEDYMLANYTQLETYWKKLAVESDRMKLVDIGVTAEGRRQYMAIVSSPANLQKLDRYQEIARRLAKAEGLTEQQARELAREGKAVVWIDGGLHASESVGAQQLMEQVYQMVSRNDPETLRLLDDTVQLYVPANPDGLDLIANWYMREADPLKRSLTEVPRLYQKYAGHDNNRDFYMSNLPETTNMNRQMFREWFPQIVYDHHQTGPAGTVIFIPPFRDPFNYNLDPLVPLQTEMVGVALHSRLVAEGKGGSTMRSGSTYSSWWNGGLRTVTYFHNMVGILTEIIGNPTPMEIPLVADKQLPSGDLPMPVMPQKWHMRQSIEYELTNNRAILDYASRYRETLLFNMWRMGMNSIERGNKDSWTIAPKRIEALKVAAKGTRLSPELYESVLHDAKYRDPRGYIIPANQDDLPTAVEFLNTLVKNGITVLQAKAAFQVNGKSYPMGSYVVKTAQAFRPHVLDMFEPQDHPNDLRPNGTPIAPYDIAGWTLAMQMGVQFDRILDAFDGPFEAVPDMIQMQSGKISGPANPAGYLISHKVNATFPVMNRLLKAGAEVYWLKQSAEPGTIWVPASSEATPVLTKASTEMGLTITAVANRPTGEVLKLKPVRVGLVDRYGGLIASGWTRWTLEQFEFPFEMVYAPELDRGDLSKKFDVLIFPDGAYSATARGGQETGNIPAEYRETLGRVTSDKTVPELKRFVETGGSVVALGDSIKLAEMMGVPMKNHLVETSLDGKEKVLDREKFYVPGSLLRAKIDNTQPLAYGMSNEAYVFFDSNPVFRLDPGSTNRVAWFDGTDVLASGWAWGQQYLNGGTAVAETSMGEGKVFLLGPEITFRGQSYGTFKLLFNALYYGSAAKGELR